MNFSALTKSITLRRGVIFVAILAIGCAVYLYSKQMEEANVIQVSGRIEALETHISAPAATRVKTVTIREGDFVPKGKLIIILDSADLQKRINQSGSALKQAKAARRATDAQIANVNQQIGRARSQSNGLLAQLFSSKSSRERKGNQLRNDMMEAKMMSFKARSIESSVESARSQASSKLSYFNITSPLDAICATRSIEPGELVTAGQVMLTLSDPKSAYLRGFVPESDIARIKVGQTAQIFLGSEGAKPLPGRVTSIDTKSAFTPENVYFKKDRVRQVFGIDISINHSDGLAKPGMPADAKIFLHSKNKN